MCIFGFMGETKITDRITYLAEQFDIFECDNNELVETKVSELKEMGLETRVLSTTEKNVIGIISSRVNERGRILKNISVSSDVFGNMVNSDPTENKIYLQWMLTVFTRLLKSDKEQDLLSAIRFVGEDLPQANAYLLLFEENKRKRKFIELCKASYSLVHVSDPTNINQYKSLSQLFDAVDPFIEREPSALERTLHKFVNSGQAEIPVKDRKFTLYIPKTTAASVVFNTFANWCTAREGNGMFNSYTERNKKPNGKNSDIYIIIDNNFFKGESENLYQIHFETNQIKDRKNSSNVNIYESVLMESEGILNFFHDELITMAKECKKSLGSNVYLDYLIQFGFSEALFELYDENVPSIRIMDREVPKIANMSRFKKIDQLILISTKLVELHPSVCSLQNLELLSLANNKLKTLPREIGNLKNLLFLNIVGNPIKEIPTEITNLDKSNGGKLHRIAVKEEEIGTENYLKLKRLLPQTEFN